MNRAIGMAVAAGLTSLLLAGCGGGGDSVSEVLDSRAPSVTYTTPSNGAADIGTNARVTVTFSEPMNDTSLASAISLSDAASGSPVSVQGVTYDPLNKIATLVPQAPLMANRSYRATVSTAATDLSGNATVADYTWTFSTSSGADNTAPTVSSVSPANGAAGVPIDTAVALSFSKPMDARSVTSAFSVTVGANVVPGLLMYAGQAAVFRPDSRLSPSTTYVARLRKAATDLAGNALVADYTWTFSTGGGTVDTTPPSVVSVAPAPDSRNVTRNLVLSVTFDEPIYPFVYGMIDGKVVDVSIDYSTSTATMTATAPLNANASYTASVIARDLSGNTMPSPYTWSFLTGP